MGGHFELHSPDAKHTVVLRCKDTTAAQAWFTAVQSAAIGLIPKVIAEVKEQTGRTGIAGSREIRHLGWLAEKGKCNNGPPPPLTWGSSIFLEIAGCYQRRPLQPPSGASYRLRLVLQAESDQRRWRPVLVMVTEKDLLLYDSMPRVKEAWYSPAHTYPLLATRLVHSGPDRGSPQPGRELSFATRTGTRLGIEAHHFRVETGKDLSLWTRHIVTGCHSSAEMIKEVTTSCMYKNQDCRLTIHYEQGFSVLAEVEGGMLMKPLFSYPFEKLKMSSDDGVRMLYLDFGGKEGEIQLDLHSCPKPIVFILHSFLSAKIARLGLVA
ncbi:hypothetical protein Z043_101794 [Scleropages formosus]|uniref:PH domain-containing protein n=1 Tax=Scleropages formosus TaxID=113540 RepID=A0A0P7UW93_SCLFO|nr:hypothetical protein Z043_101794 [Scleropages formosus]